MTLFLASTVGLCLSFGIVGLLRPALPAPWRWQGRGLVLHAGLWLVLHGLLTLILGRPWFAMAIGLAFVMLVVQVSNAKHLSLREPFVFQDFEYFTDAIRHPRLYIPFLGWWKFAAIVVAVLAALAIGLGLESVDAGVRQAAFWPMLLGGGLLLGCRPGEVPLFLPALDMARQGLFACLWDYGRAERVPLVLPDRWSAQPLPAARPDIVVVQSESFFDARQLFDGVRREVLAEFDQLRSEAWQAGSLAVPAWGANTVRSEFAFLSGQPAGALGVHRFNPYRKLLQHDVATLVGRLKAEGYRTVCIHPYPASFYGRDVVYPRLGFDEFIDIGAFQGAARCGPYVSDAALTDKIESVLARGDRPLFVFVITMENHGPLHLERVQPGELAARYQTPPPDGCEDLTIYLRHLANASRMAGRLRELLRRHPRPARLCWYGDHVPIMANVYRRLGEPAGHTEYVLWRNTPGSAGESREIALHELAAALLAD